MKIVRLRILGTLLGLFAASSSLSGCAVFGFSRDNGGDEPEQFDDPYDRAVHSGNILYGMSPAEVRQVWGEPREVSRAPAGGGERWTYFDGLSSQWSISGQRQVFFENDHVIGWHTSPMTSR